MSNYFKREIPELRDVLKNKKCGDYISLNLARFLLAVGVPQEDAERVQKNIFSLSATLMNESGLEKEIHEILGSATSQEARKMALTERADKITEQLAPHLIPPSVFDDGCGDGYVGKEIAGLGYDVVLGDVYEHEDIKSSGRVFKIFGDDEKIPLEDNKFANTILCTVLHHAKNPLFTLNEAVRVTSKGGRLLVIESVFGIRSEDAREASGGSSLLAFLALSEEEQFWANMFFDHLYNRCLYFTEDPVLKISVPYNYQSPSGWKAFFENNHCRELVRIPLGMDHPIAPLFHDLYVLEKT